MSGIESTLTEFIDASANLSGVLRSTVKLSADTLTVPSSTLNSLFPSIETLQNTLEPKECNVADSVVSSLESISSNLWNAATIAMKECSNDIFEFLCQTKLFCALMLCVHEKFNMSLERKLRCLKCFTKIFSTATDGNLPNLSSKCQKYADKYLALIELQNSELSSTFNREFKALKAESQFASMEMALKKQDFETAKFYLANANIHKNISFLGTAAVIEFCRMMYNACLALHGSLDIHSEDGDYSKNKIDNQCIFFLKSALEILSIDIKFKPEVLYKNVKFNILLLLSECYLGIDDAPLIKEAATCVSFLEKIYPTKIEPFLLSIKIQKKRPQFDSKEFQQVIMKMIMSVNVKECFENILSVINELSNFYAKGSLSCLDYLFFNKLDQSDMPKQFETALTSRVWISINKDLHSTFEEKIKDITSFLNSAEKRFAKDLSDEACSGTIVLFWTTGKKALKSNLCEAAVGWFNLCLHRALVPNIEIFDDLPKVQRNLIRSYQELKQYNKVHQVFAEMSHKEQNNPLTNYLMFLVHKECKDTESQLNCLKAIIESENSLAPSVLAACISEPDIELELLVTGLSSLVTMLSAGSIDPSLVATTLRCNIQKIINEAKNSSDINMKTGYYQLLVSLLPESFKFAERTNISVLEEKQKTEEKYTIEELTWLSSILYETARECYSSKIFGCGSSLASFSTKFNKSVSHQAPENLRDLPVWRARTLILEALCLKCQLDQLSSEDPLRADLIQKISEITQELNRIYDPYSHQQENLETKNVLKLCYFHALTVQYDVEILQSNWKALPSLVKEAYQCNVYKHISIFIDEIQNSNCSAKYMKEILSIAIEQEFTRDRHLSPLLFKCIRMFISNFIESDPVSCVLILDRAYPRFAACIKNDHSSQEIEWLAATFWNHGANLMIMGNTDEGKSWCEKAFQFSAFVNKRLEKQFRGFWPELTKICHNS